jgi:hypothetical protein
VVLTSIPLTSKNVDRFSHSLDQCITNCVDFSPRLIKSGIHDIAEKLLKGMIKTHEKNLHSKSKMPDQDHNVRTMMKYQKYYKIVPDL